jgi:hypothetical protein
LVGLRRFESCLLRISSVPPAPELWSSRGAFVKRRSTTIDNEYGLLRRSRSCGCPPEQEHPDQHADRHRRAERQPQHAVDGRVAVGREQFDLPGRNSSSPCGGTCPGRGFPPPPARPQRRFTGPVAPPIWPRSWRGGAREGAEPRGGRNGRLGGPLRLAFWPGRGLEGPCRVRQRSRGTADRPDTSARGGRCPTGRPAASRFATIPMAARRRSRQQRRQFAAAPIRVRRVACGLYGVPDRGATERHLEQYELPSSTFRLRTFPLGGLGHGHLDAHGPGSGGSNEWRTRTSWAPMLSHGPFIPQDDGA